jgi:hypothetical protein
MWATSRNRQLQEHTAYLCCLPVALCGVAVSQQHHHAGQGGVNVARENTRFGALIAAKHKFISTTAAERQQGATACQQQQEWQSGLLTATLDVYRRIKSVTRTQLQCSVNSCGDCGA